MRTYDRYGRLLVTAETTGGSTTITADNDTWPMVHDDTDGLYRFLRCETIDNCGVLWLDECSPKVQDDDDGLYRFLRSDSSLGSPALYLSTEADDVPGKEAIVRDITYGTLKRVRSKHVAGVPTIYLEDI